MEKVIPILPCPDVREQVVFYQQLGFSLGELYTSPNPYAVVKYQNIELHFWGSKKNNPIDNASMCFIRVSDVDAICNDFTSSLKSHNGKIPRTGIPRISKVRDLKEDRRFTLTDVGGNTIFIGTPLVSDEKVFFRTIQNAAHKKNFSLLYDLIYSKDDTVVAANMLPRLLAVKNDLCDLDKAKLLLIKLEVALRLNESSDNTELLLMIDQHKNDENWCRINQQYRNIISE